MGGATLALLLSGNAVFAAQSRPATSPGSSPSAIPAASASTIVEARAALEAGRPYLATRLLAPWLSPSQPEDSAIILLAARAAAGWEAWGSVIRLLEGKVWLDRLAGGEGRTLLARARVERSEDALAEARAAASGAPAGELGSRLVTLARAYDRADLLDSASLTYRRAAELLPDIAGWLLLRAAGVERDSTVRAGHFRAVVLPAALPRIRWTEALARERSGDLAGAAETYEALGATLASIRLRLRATSSPDTLAEIRRALISLLGPRRGLDDARGAIALLDANFTPLTLSEEAAVARRAAAVDRAARAATGFARLARAGPLADADRQSYGLVLARLSRHREAIEQFSQVRTRGLLAAAGYARARSLLAQGRTADALALLRRVSAEYPADTAAAAAAGYLAAELLVDRGDDAGARGEFLSVARRFPGATHGSRAALQAALIAFLAGNHRVAAAELRELSDRTGDRSETPAALYWAGRALSAAGDTAGARAIWRGVWERFPLSYYVLPVSARLELPAELIPRAEPVPDPDPEAAAALDRAALLERLGLRIEARYEYDQLVREVDATPTRLPGIAAAFAARGLISRAYRLAQRSGDPGLLRLTYPLPRPADLVEGARATGVDPLLAAALIRQESGFEPTARSRADAMGLMQVLPSLGAALARVEGIPDWRAELLFQPEINLRFGLGHLAQSLQRYGRLEHALAAYNAGGRPTGKWLAQAGAAADPEIFIERIQYVETRDYVRRVLRNLSVYRALYPAAP